MKKFRTNEANLSIELSIEIESYVNHLTKKFDKTEVTAEEYLLKRKKVDELIEKSKEIIKKWKEELNE